MLVARSCIVAVMVFVLLSICSACTAGPGISPESDAANSDTLFEIGEEETSRSVQAATLEDEIRIYREGLEVVEATVEEVYAERYRYPSGLAETPMAEDEQLSWKQFWRWQFVPIRLRVTEVYSTTQPVVTGYVMRIDTKDPNGDEGDSASTVWEPGKFGESQQGMLFVKHRPADRGQDEPPFARYLFDLASSLATGGETWVLVEPFEWYRYVDGEVMHLAEPIMSVDDWRAHVATLLDR